MAEKGDRQPRSLAGAFFKPVTGADLLEASVSALKKAAEALDAAYFGGESESFRGHECRKWRRQHRGDKRLRHGGDDR